MGVVQFLFSFLLLIGGERVGSIFLLSLVAHEIKRIALKSNKTFIKVAANVRAFTLLEGGFVGPPGW